MTEYLVPAGHGEAEIVEKRSRFIGQVWRVDSEEEARARIEETKKRRYDARHNCWCFRLKNGPERYSDDGEPQGTAGQPMLGVFQKEGMEDVCCVVTRYFGGVLLGAGGLVRAYSQSAKAALDAAGTAVVRRWIELSVPCPYALLERMKLELEAQGGIFDGAEYAAGVTLRALLPEEKVDAFCARVTDLTAGGSQAERIGERFCAAAVDK